MSNGKRPPINRKPHINANGHWVVDLIPDAQEGNEVSWTAPDDSDVTIWFPQGIRKDPLRVGTSLVKAGETLGPKIVPPDAKGRYPYSVYIHKPNVMAEGGSSPEMIIV